MAQFSRLLYVIERHNTVSRPYLLQASAAEVKERGGGGRGEQGGEG